MALVNILYEPLHDTDMIHEWLYFITCSWCIINTITHAASASVSSVSMQFGDWWVCWLLLHSVMFISEQHYKKFMHKHRMPFHKNFCLVLFTLWFGSFGQIIVREKIYCFIHPHYPYSTLANVWLVKYHWFNPNEYGIIGWYLIGNHI